jgi:hypothetical protein
MRAAMTHELDHGDLVDEYLKSLVRPLGNLFILYALAEAALRELLKHVSVAAPLHLKDKKWQTEIARLVHNNSSMDAASIQELMTALESFVHIVVSMLMRRVPI